jgi:hypothetical protein
VRAFGVETGGKDRPPFIVEPDAVHGPYVGGNIPRVAEAGGEGNRTAWQTLLLAVDKVREGA